MSTRTDFAVPRIVAVVAAFDQLRAFRLCCSTTLAPPTGVPLHVSLADAIHFALPERRTTETDDLPMRVNLVVRFERLPPKRRKRMELLGPSPIAALPLVARASSAPRPIVPLAAPPT